MRNGNPWTEAEDDTLIRCRIEGKTKYQCADALPGRTPDACKARFLHLRKRGLAPKLGRWSSAQERAPRNIKSDQINVSDRKHREAAKRGSMKLLEAIRRAYPERFAA